VPRDTSLRATPYPLFFQTRRPFSLCIRLASLGLTRFVSLPRLQPFTAKPLSVLLLIFLTLAPNSNIACAPLVRCKLPPATAPGIHHVSRISLSLPYFVRPHLLPATLRVQIVSFSEFISPYSRQLGLFSPPP